MNHRYEQKHLLHNWSDCRYRDHSQSPRAVLRAPCWSAIATLLELGRVADESFRLCSDWGERLPFFCLLGSLDDLLMFAAAKVFIF